MKEFEKLKVGSIIQFAGENWIKINKSSVSNLETTIKVENMKVKVVKEC